MSLCRLCRVYGRGPLPARNPHVCEPCRGDLTAVLDQLAARSPHAHQLEPERRDRDPLAPRPPAGPRIPVSIAALSAIGPQNLDTPAGPDQLPSAVNAPALNARVVEIAAWRAEPEPRAWYRDRALWLGARVDWACEAYPDVAGLARDIAAADRALAELAGDEPARTLVGRCTRAHDGTICGQPLRASTWDSAIDCPRCGSSWPRRDWRRLATEQASGEAA